MKILVIRTDHLGDVLLTTPLIRALAKAGHDVHVLVRRATASVFVGSPYVRAVEAIETIAPDFPRDGRAAGRWMRKGRFDAILLPHARPRQLVFAAASSGAHRKLAMWGGAWGRLAGLTCLRSGIQHGNRHLADILLDLARALDVTPDGLKTDFFLTPGESAAAKSSLRERFGDRPVIGIHPGHMGNTCNLPGKIYGEAAALLLRDGRCGVVATGLASERRLLEEWPREALKNPLLLDAVGAWDVRTFAAHLSHFSAIAVTGTGPLHLAGALGVPVAAPFCSSPSLCSTVWGSRHPGSVHLAAPPEHCRAFRSHSRGHCDFAGIVDGPALYKACLRAARLSTEGRAA